MDDHAFYSNPSFFWPTCSSIRDEDFFLALLVPSCKFLSLSSAPVIKISKFSFLAQYVDADHLTLESCRNAQDSVHIPLKLLYIPIVLDFQKHGYSSPVAFSYSRLIERTIKSPTPGHVVQHLSLTWTGHPELWFSTKNPGKTVWTQTDPWSVI